MLKPSVNADNYYFAYPSWLSAIVPLSVELSINVCEKFTFSIENVLTQILQFPDSTSQDFILKVDSSLSGVSKHYTIHEGLFFMPLVLKTHYFLPSNILNIILPLSLNPDFKDYRDLEFYLPASLSSLLFSASCIYSVLNLEANVLSTSIRDIQNINVLLSDIDFINYEVLDFNLPLFNHPIITTESEYEGILSVAINNTFVPFIHIVPDIHIIQNLDTDIFSSSIKNLHIPINLFFNYVSSMLSIINFSDTLNTSSKMALENMIETIVPATFKDTYISEYEGKATLTVSTDAEFVPLIQMIYEYSLTASLLYSPLLTTIKKAAALIKYLTIDIKKFNISIDIETIEQDG